MTKDDIIKMAREAGLEDGWAGWCQECGCDSDKLTRFAALVRADEREACAKVCDVRAVQDGWEGCYADECAAEIRARSKQ